jgi:hypothetical protein
MPPKKQIKNKKKKRVAKANSNSDIQKITKMMSQMQAPKSQVSDLGRMLIHGGNMLGGLVGLPTIFGSGDYECNQNSLWTAGQQVPFMHSQSESVTLRHREYIQDISIFGPNFASEAFAINPGLGSTFPFLSAIAQNFQEYTFKGLVFEFKTTSATALASGTNTALGSVMLAVQYRSDAAPFTSKQTMLNEMWSVDCAPSASCLLPVECAPLENPMSIQYVRAGPATGDIKMYDLGLLTVATAGGQTGQNNVVGELWVSYEVELRKPQVIVSALDVSENFIQYTTSSYTNAVPILNSVPTFAFGEFSTTAVPFLQPGIFYVSGTSSFQSFQVQGTYLVVMSWSGSSVVDSAPSITSVNSTLSGVLLNNGLLAGTYIISFHWNIPDPNQIAAVVFGSTGTFPTSGSARFNFYQVNAGVANLTP